MLSRSLSVSAAMQEEDGLAGLGLLWMNPPPPHAAFVDRLEINIMGQGTGGNEGVVDRLRLGARRPQKSAKRSRTARSRSRSSVEIRTNSVLLC